MTTYTSATAAPFPHSSVRVSYVTGDSLVSRVWSTVMRCIQLELTEDRVVAGDDVILPGWVIPIVRRVRLLESLPSNWDSYGGVPLQRRHRDAALRFLGLVMTDDIEHPDIVPLADGGIQLEWRRDGVDVDFISDDEVEVPTLYVTSETGSHELQGVAAADYFLQQIYPTLRGAEIAAA